MTGSWKLGAFAIVLDADEADEIAYFALAHIPRNTLIKQVERIQDALSADARPHLKVQLGPASRDRAEQARAIP